MEIKTKDFRIVSLQSGKLGLITNYNPDVVKLSHKLNAKWNKPYWVFDERDLDSLKEGLKEIYGTDGSEDIKIVDIKIFLDKYSFGSEIFLFGRQILKRWRRDSKVILGDGVIVLEGGFHSSGGSVKNPRIDAKTGTILLIRDVPLPLFEKEKEKCGDCVEIVEQNKNVEKIAELNKQFIREVKIRDEIVSIYLVNQTYIKDNWNIEFTEGGHHWKKGYEQIPDGQIWISQDLNEKDKEATIVHEIDEFENMKYNKMSYDEAHDIANDKEGEFRHSEVGQSLSSEKSDEEEKEFIKENSIKESWQMTKNEYIELYKNFIGGYIKRHKAEISDKLLKANEGLRKAKELNKTRDISNSEKLVSKLEKKLENALHQELDPDFVMLIKTERALEHEKKVKQAISEGKIIPEEVLKDYPELKTKQESNATKELDKNYKIEKISDTKFGVYYGVSGEGGIVGAINISKNGLYPDYAFENMEAKGLVDKALQELKNKLEAQEHIETFSKIQQGEIKTPEQLGESIASDHKKKEGIKEQERPQPKFKVNDFVSYEGGDVYKEIWYGIITEVKDFNTEYGYRIDAYGYTEDGLMFSDSKNNEKYEVQLRLSNGDKFKELKKKYEETYQIKDVEPQNLKSNIPEHAKPPKQDDVNAEIRKLLDTKGLQRHLYTKNELLMLAGYTGDSKTQGELEDGYLWDYYTPDELVRFCWQLAYKYGFRASESKRVLEPALGVGRFLRYCPDYVKATGYEIDKYSSMISQLLYPRFNIINDSFESHFYFKTGLKSFDYKAVWDKYNLVIGNPPYKYPYDSVYKDKEKNIYNFIASLEQWFIVRGLDALEKGGLLIYIVPSTIIDNNNSYAEFKEEMFKKADMLDCYRIPAKTFTDTDITTDLIILSKK